MTDDTNDPLTATALRREIMDAMTETLGDMVTRLPPVTRLRLLAFMHLFDNPGVIRADLAIEPTGSPRLILGRAMDLGGKSG